MASQIGKIYICAACGAQVIVTKGGTGTLSAAVRRCSRRSDQRVPPVAACRRNGYERRDRRSWRSGSSRDARTVGGSGFLVAARVRPRAWCEGRCSTCSNTEAGSRTPTSSTCYAGSGALGIEALSRGARAVVFVETSSGVAARPARQPRRRAASRERAEVLRHAGRAGAARARAARDTGRRRDRGPAVRPRLGAAAGRSAGGADACSSSGGLGRGRARCRRDTGRPPRSGA